MMVKIFTVGINVIKMFLIIIPSIRAIVRREKCLVIVKIYLKKRNYQNVQPMRND